MLLINWFHKRLGYHVCEEFTRWETKQVDCTVVLPLLGPERFEDTKRWQERECTICDKV